MGRTRSRSKKAKRSSFFSRLVTVVWILVGGGAMVLWAGRDLPLVGPLVQSVTQGGSQVEEPDTTSQQTETDQLIDAGNQAAKALREPSALTSASSQAGPSSQPSAGADGAIGTIRIASFNTPLFDESTRSPSWVVDILAQIVREFDVVAIQGIRGGEASIIPEFVQSVNADGGTYNYVVGPPIGRAPRKEQYAFVYDTKRIEIDITSSGTIQDPKDQLLRDPFVSRFRARTPNPSKAFTFWLVNVHTDPDEVAREVKALADVFIVMRQARADEDDVILLGNFNANSQQFGLLGQVPRITWVVRDTITNTRRQAMHDNILFDHVRTTEYTGRWGVYQFPRIYQLTREQALAVSDHLPVWAEFESHEAGAGNAAVLPSDQMIR
ncbi:MAG: endonuclease/exonuclease/phosphatase family protein [Planctomycetota bacterium]